VARLHGASQSHDPDNPGHYELRGYAYLRRYQINGRTDPTDLENAILDLERAVVVDSTYEWGYYNLGLAYWERGREEDTFRTLGRLFTLNPRFRGVVAGVPQYQRIIAAEGFADLGS
jgi:tetratricopeptide (TPR) repeat protein